MKRIWMLPLFALVLLLICVAAFDFGVMFERDWKRTGSPPRTATPQFTEGFESGVKYGDLARSKDPDASPEKLLINAKLWYFEQEVKRGRGRLAPKAGIIRDVIYENKKP